MPVNMPPVLTGRRVIKYPNVQRVIDTFSDGVRTIREYSRGLPIKFIKQTPIKGSNPPTYHYQKCLYDVYGAQVPTNSWTGRNLVEFA